jgi:hypothetical protein
MIIPRSVFKLDLSITFASLDFRPRVRPEDVPTGLHLIESGCNKP